MPSYKVYWHVIAPIRLLKTSSETASFQVCRSRSFVLVTFRQCHRADIKIWFGDESLMGGMTCVTIDMQPDPPRGMGEHVRLPQLTALYAEDPQGGKPCNL